MASAITQALSSLLPSQQPPPPRLVQLSNSLLAQSHIRASHLKPEEEIARPHACAEIACNRLCSRLRLPPVAKGRPPCKPGVYKKLLAFLEGVLAEQQTTRNETIVVTPKKRGTDRQPKVVQSTANTTPSKGKKTLFAGKIGPLGKQDGAGSLEAPEWAMQLIRDLCVEFGTPLLPPHVYTGLCVVLKLANIWPALDETNYRDLRGDISALIIALYLLVLTRMQQNDMTTSSYNTKCAKAVKTAGLSDEAAGMKLVETWIKRINKEEWCAEQEWWANVPEGLLHGPDDDETEVGSGGLDDADDITRSAKRRKKKAGFVAEELEKEDPEGVLLPGLGTMMQDAVDWLSEERKEEYLEWEKAIVAKVKAVERGRGRLLAIR